MQQHPSVILMTSNGVGMGHISRQLTIALDGPKKFAATIFSLSRALPRIIQAETEGELPEASPRDLRFEYCPSRESGWRPDGGWQAMLRRHYGSYRWHPYLRDRLLALANETSARAVVFDGVVPYQGLLQARAALPETAFVWVRRGMWKPDSPAAQLSAAEHFDLVLEPGDFAASADTGPTVGRSDARRISPISLTRVLTMDDKLQARQALGLPTDRPVLLLAPGSGALGSVDATATVVREELARIAPEWIIAVTRQSIARHNIGAGDDSIVVLDDVYPLARYLATFDAAVSAAGYNSVHELLDTGVPTLLVPSTNNVTDDQLARAGGVAARGAAILGGGDLPRDIQQLLDADVRAELTKACRFLEPPTGGAQGASAIAELATGVPANGEVISFPPVRRPVIDARTPALPNTETALMFTEQVTSAMIRGVRPVEHILPGSSEAYWRQRRQLADWIYRTH